MSSALAFMDIGEELDAMIPRNAREEDSVGTASIEGPLHQHVPFGDACDSLAPFSVLGKSQSSRSLDLDHQATGVGSAEA